MEEKTELKFKNTTKYSQEVYMKFLEFHNQKYGLRYRIYTVLFVILLLYCIIINFKYDNIDAAIIFIIVLGLFVYYRYFSQVKIVKKELESDKIKKEDEFTFYFYEKYFKIRDKAETCKLKYRKIRKVHKTEEYYYLYLDKTHSYILDRNGFSVGNEEEFEKFIKSIKRIMV